MTQFLLRFKPTTIAIGRKGAKLLRENKISGSSDHIMVIDPAQRVPELDCLNYFQTRSSLPLSYHLPALHGFSTFPEPDNQSSLKGVIVLGSGASALDKSPWISQLYNWLETYFSQEKPFLGLCYGHQILAHLFGAKIGLLNYKGSKAQEYRSVEMKNSPLNTPSIIDMIVSHKEIVSQLPKDFTLWGSSAAVEIDAIRHASLPFYGIQGHPEATAGFFENQSIDDSYDQNRLTPAHNLVLKFIESCSK